MKHIPGVKEIQLLLKQFEKVGRLLSTGAEVVDFSGDLYNVTGSTDDPPAVDGHENRSWKQLLIHQAGWDEDASCYVANVAPSTESSHPNFSVGGHMTTNSNGVVEEGDYCYLMPLCSWHNNTARDNTRFEHSETKMLRLTGYMQGELATTFELRQPSREPFALLYFDPTDLKWKHKNLSNKDRRESKSVGSGNNPIDLRVLLERSKADKALLHIKESTLPD